MARLYDFLWSLHIMDYKERDNFNHPLVIVAASFAMLLTLSGIIVLFMKLRRQWMRVPRKEQFDGQ